MEIFTSTKTIVYSTFKHVLINCLLFYPWIVWINQKRNPFLRNEIKLKKFPWHKCILFTYHWDFLNQQFYIKSKYMRLILRLFASQYRIN